MLMRRNSAENEAWQNFEQNSALFHFLQKIFFIKIKYLMYYNSLK